MDKHSHSFSRSLAIVIGINRYSNGISSLHTAVNDAREVARILEQEHKYDEVRSLLDEAASLQELRQLFKDLPGQIQPNDRLLFYFAGHGIALNGDDGPEGYLIPQDAKLGDTKSYLPMSELQAFLNDLHCRHFLGVLDCCFAGAFRWSSTRQLLVVEEGIVHKERFDRFIADPAWQVITSAAYDQTALDSLTLDTERGKVGNHSPFAAALIEALSAGKADVYPPADVQRNQPAGDGVTTATDLYVYLRDRIEPATEGIRQRQTPGIWTLKKHDKGEYIFLTPGHILNLPPAPPLDVLSNPYQGLESFEEEHSKLFFGRTELVKELQIFVKTHPLTVVLGASGSGKSSLVKAGLIPELRKETAGSWVILPTIRPGEAPLQSLNNALKDAQFPEVVQHPQQSLSMSITVWAKSHPNAQLFLFIDQSEEVITLCQNENERHEFFQQILQALSTHRDKLRVVLSLRSDFESQVRDAGLMFASTSLHTKKPELNNHWQSGRFIVPVMKRGELREAIEKPAEARVMYFQPYQLVEQLIDEVADMPGALPLLSFALSELYLKYLNRQWQAENRGITIDRSLTQDDYQDLGGVIRSLTQRADEEYEALVQKDPAYAQIIRQVMMRMVALGGGELARRRVSLSELEYPTERNYFVEAVIEQFTKARLLVKGEDAEGKPYVEPAHDALVRGWQKLLTWKKAEEENLLLQRRLTPAAEEWQSQQQARFLWNANPRLDLLKKVLNSEDNWLNSVEAEFVKRSVSKKRSNTIVRWSLAGLALSGSVIFSAAVWTQWRNSQLNLANSLGQYSLSLLTEQRGLEAWVQAIKAGKILQQFNTTSPAVINALLANASGVIEGNRLEGKNVDATSFGFSADSKTLATSGNDHTIELWNLETGEKIKSLSGHHESEIFSISFSPDGRTLASGSDDKTIKLWDLDTGAEIYTLRGHTDLVRSISFSPNGRTLASGSDDGTIKLWDLESNQVRMALQGKATNFSFSPDGRTLTTASVDSTVTIWNLDTGTAIRSFKADDSNFSFVGFSPDGRTLGIGGFGRTIKLVNVKKEDEVRTIGKLGGGISDVSFSPNGKTLVSSGYPQRIKLWNAKTNQEIRILEDSNNASAARISPDGKIVAAININAKLELWNLETGQKIPIALADEAGDVFSFGFSSDGKTLTAASSDNTIKSWNLETGKEIHNYRLPEEDRNISFSPDGKTFASHNDDYTITLWNLETGKEIRTLRGHTDGVMSVSFSPDGKTLASGSSDRTIKLWNLETGSEIRTLRGHERPVRSVNFSPDGKTLVSGSEDKTIKLWNLEPGKEEDVRTLQGHTDGIGTVSFSPDGKTLVSGSFDETIKLWNLDFWKLSLESLMERSCDWARVYLQSNPNVSESDRDLCNGISDAKPAESSSVAASIPALPPLPCSEPSPLSLPFDRPGYYKNGEYYGSLEGTSPPDGQFTAIFPSGDRYDGQFANGKRNGCGTYTFPSGNRYVGEFRNDKFNGQGEYVWNDQASYKGAFLGNKCHGQGTLTLANGTSKSGEWQNGNLVGGSQSDSCDR